MSKIGLLDLVAIKSATPFMTVLSHYDLTPERPGAKQVKICCPFHDDATPSCSINIERNIYKCFGCQASGNVLDFIAEMEEITENPTYHAALQALEIIGEDASDYAKASHKPGRSGKAKKTDKAKPAKKAQKAPVEDDAKSEAPTPTKTTNPMITVELTLDHDHPFLAERNITPDIAEAFGIGYCGNGIMKGRIAVPIHNLAGELIAFTGRWAEETTPDKKTPRYKLPKGFEKSLDLFNIHRAAAYNKPNVVIVEGIWSAIRLHQSGIPTIALLGTDVSEAQAELLVSAGFRHAVLILDGDDAGRQATPTALATLTQHLYVKSLVLPKGTKPDTMDEAIVHRLRR